LQKDEIIQLHTFLFQLKINMYVMFDNDNDLEFLSYDKLNVTPHHVHKSKREHELAVFTLSMGIAKLLSHNNCPCFEKISNRLAKISECYMTKKEKELTRY